MCRSRGEVWVGSFWISQRVGTQAPTNTLSREQRSKRSSASQMTCASFRISSDCNLGQWSRSSRAGLHLLLEDCEACRLQRGRAELLQGSIRMGWLSGCICEPFFTGCASDVLGHGDQSSVQHFQGFCCLEPWTGLPNIYSLHV